MGDLRELVQQRNCNKTSCTSTILVAKCLFDLVKVDMRAEEIRNGFERIILRCRVELTVLLGLLGKRIILAILLPFLVRVDPRTERTQLLLIDEFLVNRLRNRSVHANRFNHHFEITQRRIASRYSTR